MRGRRCGTLAAVVAMCVAVASDARAETRKAEDWPFAATSPWNSAIGTSAQFGSAACDGDVQAQAASPASAWINAEQYSAPVFMAAGTDTQKTVYESASPDVPVPTGTNKGTYRYPSAAAPAAGTDRGLAVVAPDRQTTVETWRTYVNPLFVNVGDFASHNLVTGSGFQPAAGFGPHAANASYLGGLLRTKEAQAGQFRHALAISLPPARLSPDGPVLPATSIDNDHSQYAGSVHMGQLLALPQSVDVDSLGLASPMGRAIAVAMQKYGGYVVDKGGALALWAEPSSQSYIAPARQWDANNVSDMMRITARLRCVTNNAPGAWGGGGTPLAPPPPPFG